MKAHSRPIEVDAVQFDVPEASRSLVQAEIRAIEQRYNVRFLTTARGPLWMYGKISEVTRSVIHPGDWIVSGPEGIKILPDWAFHEHYEPN